MYSMRADKALYEYMLGHVDDILLGVNDFGELMPVLAYFVSIADKDDPLNIEYTRLVKTIKVEYGRKRTK